MSPSSPNQNPDHLTGLIERVTFHSPESGFAVLRVKVRGQRELVTVIGTLPNVTAGEWLDAEGHWAVDPEHGQQFKAHTLRTSQPSTAEGMTKYLGSGLIKGIGPKFASRLVTTFDTGVFHVIEQSPERLLDVEGIGKVRQQRITKAWAEQKSVRNIMVFLHSHGVGTSRAFRIYKTYGDESIEKIQENPYRLAHDIWGIGFKTADQLAERLGIHRESDLRARAGVEYVLQTLTDEGHCAYPRTGLMEKSVEVLGIAPTIVETAIDYDIEQRTLMEHDDAHEPLIYLSALDTAEQQLAKKLMALSRSAHPCPPIHHEKAIEWVEKKLRLRLAPAQRAAIKEATQSKLMVITGGPGVGKTTLVNAIVHILAAKKMNVVLCAPTGRAARRLTESTMMMAKTIHRLLEFDPSRAKFKHDAHKPLKGDVFIVDEASMIDLILAYQLIRAIPHQAALILIGDIDQLPSVGPGNVLRDVIQSDVVPVCRLTDVFRQAARSAIITNAHRINQGLMPRWQQKKIENPQDMDFFFVEQNDPEKIPALIVRLIKERIPHTFGFDPIEDIQLLTPMQRGSLGARNLNLILQQELNPSQEEVQRFGWSFRKGDKVMQIVNNYDKDVFNGQDDSVIGRHP